LSCLRICFLPCPPLDEATLLLSSVGAYHQGHAENQTQTVAKSVYLYHAKVKLSTALS
jgi:hypothetical protein